MEHSSPLAAMQPPSMLLGHCFRAGVDPPPTSFPHAGRKLFAPPTFNFKDRSMNTSHLDYFSSKPIHGSSPAASLAADLSQNFHIDKRYELFLSVLSLSRCSIVRHFQKSRTPS
jgi:M-phase inducer tyrosine phosphatase